MKNQIKMCDKCGENPATNAAFVHFSDVQMTYLCKKCFDEWKEEDNNDEHNS